MSTAFFLLIFLCALALLVASTILIRGAHREGLLQYLSRQKSRKYLLAVVVSIFGCLSASAFLILRYAQNDLSMIYAQALSNQVTTQQDSVTRWINGHLRQLQQIAYSLQGQGFFRRLNASLSAPDELGLVDERIALSQYLSNYPAADDQLDLLLIGRDGKIIGSLDNRDITRLSAISTAAPAQFARLMAGEPVFVAPIPASGRLFGQRLIRGRDVPPTMFFAAPVFDTSGEVISVLARRVNPHGTFTQILSLGHLGLTSESYAFDQQGRMLSESRFVFDLHASGFLEPAEQGILSITLSDPTQSAAAELTQMAQQAIAGHNGVNVAGYNNYLGQRVIGAWRWDEHLNIGFAVEQSAAEAFAAFYELRRMLIAVVVISTMISAALMMLLVRISTRTFQTQQQEKARLESTLQ